MYTLCIHLKTVIMHTCQKCGKPFAQKSHLTQHQKRKTPCVYLQETQPTPPPNNNVLRSRLHELGQYFTCNALLQSKVCEFIKNDPQVILEPSVGQGHLIQALQTQFPTIVCDMYEIDETLQPLSCVERTQIVFGDFLTIPLNKHYVTIIGNPPYVRTKTGNLYIDFIRKCFHALDDSGELIFIVPSDFFKLTSSSDLLQTMMENGTFTHIYHPHNENLFANASIDVLVFRYCKNASLEKMVQYNDERLYVHHQNGLVSFSKEKQEDDNGLLFSSMFHIYVGLVNGKEEVYKHDTLGNIELLNGEDKRQKYIYLNTFPSENAETNAYMLEHKDTLINRKIRNFSEKNWYEWGAPRNISAMEKHKGEPCIYLYNLTRQSKVAFLDNVQYFGGALLILIPKKKDVDLVKSVDYLNSPSFRNMFLFSGRFKIGHRQISNCTFPNSCFKEAAAGGSSNGTSNITGGA